MKPKQKVEKHNGSANAFFLYDCNHFVQYGPDDEPYCCYAHCDINFCADVDGWECPYYTIFGMTKAEYDRECRRLSM